jgi:lincosamide nucleotidyltransferase A/C/D/E
MMTKNDVTNLLKNAKNIGVDVWITGGWGVDALIGHQTRPHNDIDVFIKKNDATGFIEMLISNGYQETNMDYTTDDHTVWCDSHNRIIDLHLFELTDEKTLRFENELYPADVFNGKGTIGEIVVRCLTAEAQLLFHHGYEHHENDIHDVLLLCKTFDFPIPEQYTT